MTLDQLRYALEVQRTKSFSRAAEACHITQPSLSVQIAKLEEELGVSLFDRARSGVEATDYGKELLKQARVILDETSRLEQSAKDLKGEVQGEFKLGVIPTLAPTVLPKFLKHFAKAFPKATITVTEEPTERLVHDIDQGQLDGAILSTPAKSPESLLEKVLFYEPFLVFASTGHPILQNKILGTDQLSADEILLLDDTHCLRDQALQLCRSKQKAPQQRLRIKSGGLQTLIEYLRENPGFTLIPSLAADLLSSREREINVRHFAKPLPSRKVSLVFHNTRLKRSLIDAIHSSVLEAVGDRVIQVGAKTNIRVLSPSTDHFEL